MPSNVRYSYFYDKFDVVHRNELPTYLMPPHTHNAIEIYLNLTALPNAMLGTTLLSLDADVLLIIPSYCIHQFTQEKDKSYERYILTINTAWFDSIMNEGADIDYLKDTNNPLLIPLDEKRKTTLINHLQNCIDCGDKDIFHKMSYFFETMAYVQTLADDAVSKKVKAVKPKLSETQKTVNDMIEFINEHLYENIKIQQIADEFFISSDYASKIFKKYTNSTIGNYITIQRITRAKQLLREGNSVTDAQLRTGYQSYEHFFRTFKKIVGMTPKEYKITYQA